MAGPPHIAGGRRAPRASRSDIAPARRYRAEAGALCTVPVRERALSGDRSAGPQERSNRDLDLRTHLLIKVGLRGQPVGVYDERVRVAAERSALTSTRSAQEVLPTLRRNHTGILNAVAGASWHGAGMCARALDRCCHGRPPRQRTGSVWEERTEACGVSVQPSTMVTASPRSSASRANRSASPCWE